MSIWPWNKQPEPPLVAVGTGIKVDYYAKQVEAYNAQIEAFNRAVEGAKMQQKIIVTIRECENGYIADVSNTPGEPTTVVGKTLAEICDAVQSAAATRKLSEEAPRLVVPNRRVTLGKISSFTAPEFDGGI